MDTGSDHQLVMANIKLKLKKNRTPVSVNKIDIQKLKDPSTREKFHAAVENKWGKVSHQPPEDVQVLWQKVKNTITETSKEELGHMPKRQQTTTTTTSSSCLKTH